MELADIERFSAQAADSVTAEARQAVATGLRYYVETGRPFACHFYPPETTIEMFTDLLGAATFDGSAISYIYYASTAQLFDEHVADPQFSGPWTASEVEAFIGDRYAMIVEFPNNYLARFAVKLDDDTSMVICCETDEQPGICDDCYADKEYMEFNRDYSCDHDVPEEVDHRGWGVVLRTAELENFDWYDGNPANS